MRIFFLSSLIISTLSFFYSTTLKANDQAKPSLPRLFFDEPLDHSKESYERVNKTLEALREQIDDLLKKRSTLEPGKDRAEMAKVQREIDRLQGVMQEYNDWYNPTAREAVRRMRENGPPRKKEGHE